MDEGHSYNFNADRFYSAVLHSDSCGTLSSFADKYATTKLRCLYQLKEMHITHILIVAVVGDIHLFKEYIVAPIIN